MHVAGGDGIVYMPAELHSGCSPVTPILLLQYTGMVLHARCNAHQGVFWDGTQRPQEQQRCWSQCGAQHLPVLYESCARQPAMEVTAVPHTQTT